MDDKGFYDITEQENNDPPLTPSYHGKDCLGNGEKEGIECCCEHALACFPDWKELQE